MTAKPGKPKPGLQSCSDWFSMLFCAAVIVGVVFLAMNQIGEGNV